MVGAFDNSIVWQMQPLFLQRFFYASQTARRPIIVFGDSNQNANVFMAKLQQMIDH